MPTINTQAMNNPIWDMMFKAQNAPSQQPASGNTSDDQLQSLGLLPPKPFGSSMPATNAEYPEQAQADYPENPQAAINVKNIAATQMSGMAPNDQPAPQQAPQMPMNFSSSMSAKTAAPGASTASIDRLLKKMGSDDREGYKLQLDQINRMKGLRDVMPTGPQGMDLSGLMALADNWQNNGGQFTKAYQKPEGAMDRLLKINSLDENVLKAGQNMDKEARDALKDQLTGEVAKLNSATELAKARASAGIGLTPGQEAADKEFGKEYSNYVASGGFAEPRKNLEQLKDSIAKISDPSLNVSGPGIGMIPKSIRDVLPWTAKGAAVQDTVEDVVQRSMRQIMGPQFTENEGKRLLERAFNPKQTPDENKIRVERIVNSLQAAANAKEQAARYFESNRGSIAGFKGNVNPTGFFADQMGEEDPELSAIRAELQRRKKI